jgi:ubiquinone/menaquinone biosynthesis C-methylase UbiE
MPNMEVATRDRYARGAGEVELQLCCPVDYDPKLLAAIPAEVLARDYGCGDPTRWLRPGETVLDLGSGSGKACFLASQVVGPEGLVLGVDMTAEMLALARGAAPVVAARLGWANVEFRRGRIQDLALDLDRLDAELARRPVASADAWLEAQATATRLRRDEPMIAEESIDVVVSNCVLNLVESTEKERLFAEIFRVLRRHGRTVVSDIVSDEPVPEHLRRDPELWSGCVSGALTEEGFLSAFERAGFHGMRILAGQREPWRSVEGIEFRPLTVEAFKGKHGPCFEHRQAVVYRGPFKEVLDDDGHRIERGRRTAVCAKTFELYRAEPYRDHFDLVEPRVPIDPASAEPFDCARTAHRHPRESKGLDHRATTEPRGPVCGPDGCC